MAGEDDSKTELTSWKEIAEFLGVSVRTAQRYEQEMSLPVRRAGGEKGRGVVARVDDLTAWKTRLGPTPRWWQSIRFLQMYAVASTGLALVFGVFVLRGLIDYWRLGKPHHSNWVFSTLIVADGYGRELWRRTFDDAPRHDQITERYHGDLDGDGRLDTLVPYITWQSDSKGSALYCFSEKGKELWKIEQHRAVSDRRTKFSTIYILRSYKVFDSPEKDGTRWVIATFAHHYEYPAVVMVVDGRGRTRGEYWHSGHLDEIHLADIDNDGREELLLAGSSRDSSRAVIEIFDPKNLSGAQVLPPEHPNQLLAFPPGSEKATIRFERSRLNKLKDHYNYAYWIGASKTGDGSFQVRVSEGLGPTKGYLTYTIHRDLTLASVVASDSLLNTYLEYSLQNPTSKPFGDTDLEELRQGYSVIPRGKKVASR